MGDEMTSLFWTSLLAFIMSAIFCLGLRGLARDWYLLDVPNARKKHDGTVPLCGGIAIFLTFFFCAFLAPSMVGSANAALLLPGLLLILTTGVLDDRFDLPVTPRLVMQLTAGFVIIVTVGLEEIHLGLGARQSETLQAASSNVWGDAVTGPLFLLLALAFIVGLVNAVNMSDGVDGLSGSASAVSFFWLALISFKADQQQLGLQSLILSSACIGFLIFNMRHRFRSRASIFLGDGGSTLLGASLAGIILILANRQISVEFPILLWIVIVPVVDTLSLIVRRLAARKSPFSPDRQHLHHLLLDRGFSIRQTAFTICFLNFFAGAIAFGAIALNVPAWVMSLALIIPFSAHILFVLRSSKSAPLINASVSVDATPSPKPKITLPGATS